MKLRVGRGFRGGFRVSISSPPVFFLGARRGAWNQRGRGGKLRSGRGFLGGFRVSISSQPVFLLGARRRLGLPLNVGQLCASAPAVGASAATGTGVGATGTIVAAVTAAQDLGLNATKGTDLPPLR